MYGLFPTETKELLLERIKSSIENSTVDLGMVNEDFKIEFKPMSVKLFVNVNKIYWYYWDFLNATVSVDVMTYLYT